MQLTSRLRRTIAWVPCLAVAGASPAAGGVEDQQALLNFEYFADSDHVHVYSTGGDYAAVVGEASRVRVSWNREVVIVPGITAPPGSQEAVDSISGASRPISPTQDPFSDFRKTRNQIRAQGTYSMFSGGYYVSNETDYFAQQLSAGVEKAFFDDNLVLNFSSSYGWDKIEPVEDDDTSTAADEKNTFHAAVVATQVVTPTTIVQAGVEMANVDGLLHNPYRNVYVDGNYVPELHPDTRSRRDAFVKLNQYLLNRSSVKLSYKIYNDDWGILSSTVGAKLNQYVTNDVVVRYRYRYYTQTASDFFSSDYTEPGGIDGYQTGDYRMGEFTAHLFGAKLSWNLGRGPIAIPALDGIRMNVKYERYFNSNNFSANIFESGFAFSF